MTDAYCVSCRQPVETLKSCSTCKANLYCSKECQKNHWPVHKRTCRAPLNADEVLGIKLLCNREIPPSANGSDNLEQRIQQVVLKKNHHPIFRLGDVCPATARYGLPLLVLSDWIHQRKAAGGCENQPAVYMRIDVDSGLAPMSWQINDPDTCYFVRQDCKPLTREAMEACHAFHSMLLSEVYGWSAVDGWAPACDMITPAVFQHFCRKYYSEQREKGRKQFGWLTRPL